MASGAHAAPRSDSRNVSPTFARLGVAAEICDALARQGITQCFAIQELTLPLALAGQDIIGQARTGMGKTLGFGVPLLDRIFDDATVTPLDGSPRALVIVPTRELCLQVAEDLMVASEDLEIPAGSGRESGINRTPGGDIPGYRVTVTAVYGGVGFDKQVQALESGSDVVVGTPGRLIDLLRQGKLQLSSVEILVLDEADEMLDQGFLDDVKALMAATNPQRQTMLFSATLPGPIMALTRTFMRQPVMIQADAAATEATHTSTRQVVFQSHRMDRMSTLSRILQSPGRGRTIVFARTKRAAAQIAQDLAEWGFAVGAVHGDMGQADREKSLADFRTGAVNVLVATDVAARGIDVSDVTHVINYQVPEDERTYVHRIGRTGRAGNSGTAVTLVGWDEVARWNAINEALGLDHANPPQWFSQSPEFLAEFGLPEDPKALQDRVGQRRRVAGSRAVTAPATRARARRSGRGQEGSGDRDSQRSGGSRFSQSRQTARGAARGGGGGAGGGRGRSGRQGARHRRLNDR